MDSLLSKAIQTVQKSKISFTKFIRANDTGMTGGHQAGFHIHKNAWKLFFNTPGVKGSNKDKYITIKWQDDFETASRFVYYGKGTRNEYRLTRFGKGFPFLQEERKGDLLIITKKSSGYYEAFVLQSDEEIEEFLAALNIPLTAVNGIIPKQFENSPEDKSFQCFSSYIRSLKVEFPSTIELATHSRNCYNLAFNIRSKQIQSNPDKEILMWLNIEFQLFKLLENDRYSKRIKQPFKTVEELVEAANTILNRRKSRAGKSLEHHLAAIFSAFKLSYASQALTEDKKRPDFLFPSAAAYLNPQFNNKRLVFLAAKTTCKDRWRQVLNEADRIKIKHLFTLQQGISKNQLKEMYKNNVCLVVPKANVRSFPKEFRGRIMTLTKFVHYVRMKQL